ncbi:helix-turn-helix transcriptional regulator [Chryseobacterium oryctis]|uniref:Helix-turn-helix transcriptional regulator n=1 Tax=Chryseobacterium oryctis TaxID=2952618 RepID=A0ABT3HS05_9FLAO|nr:helix-turn-helix transcriptional regulator [Chryseobacterium oryctis]MCW3162564.1 helix-turn-helix transcriptional regulator [Chryseobacterium oryctis]
MIKNKLIKARKEKYTQEGMAKILHMTQSQYQRREKGEIKISDEEWERMAKALNTTIEEIKEDDSTHQVINHFYNIPEFILENQQEYINLLKKQVEELKEEIRILKS